jgi:hypothetical protein
MIYLTAALFVTRIPYINKYISLSYILPYEVIKALIGGGDTKRIILNRNETMNNESFKHTFTNYASYTAIPLASIGLFYLVSTNYYQWILYIFISLIACSLLFWIRKFFDIIWLLSFGTLLALPIYLGYDIAVIHLSIFLASYILIQSVLSALQVCWSSFSLRQRKGLVGKIIGVPSMLLGVALVGQSLYAGYFIVSNFTLHLGLPWTGYDIVQLPWV